MAPVSVVMPCFNAAPYLREAIESVLGQSHQPLELIVVDDGSTDASAAVARSFGAAVVRLAQEHQGISAARNTGLARATGTYLAFCDADDVWPEGSLATRVAALAEHPDCDYAFGLVQNFLSPELPPERARGLSFPTEALPARMAGALLVRREAFARVGPFTSVSGISETIEWCTRAADAGLTGHAIDRVVLRRRIHGANTTLRTAAPMRQYLRTLKSALDRRRGTQV